MLEKLDLTTTGFDMEVKVIVRAVVQEARIGWVDIRTIYGVSEVSCFHPARDSARFGRMLWYRDGSDVRNRQWIERI